MSEGKNKILIVEDEKALARALELKLTHEGYDVKSVSNGEEALALIEKEKFAVVICDLVMPRVDGFQVLSTIKEKKIDTIVIILTNLSQSDDEKRCLALGATDFCIKSNTPLSEIVEKVKEKVKPN